MALCNTSLPIFPSPTIPRVLLRNSEPTSLCRFHSPFEIPWCPEFTFLDKANIKASVCSAALIVFASGVLITTTPRLVAAEISMLSTPTPALPMTERLTALLIIFEFKVVPLLIIHPLADLICSKFSSIFSSGT